MQRNPFRIRTSEQSSTQEEFLSLFGSDVLEMLPNSGLWDRLVILEAAPGAGKSTILRLFTPEVLKEVHRNKGRSENHDLVRQLEDLGAISSSGLNVLGTLVSCRGQYAAIDDLSLTPAEKNRWFFGLLDARLTLLILKTVCTFADLQYPDDLVRLNIKPDGSVTDTARIPTNGMHLFREAAKREDFLATAIDSLTNQAVDTGALRTELTSLRLLSGSRLELDGLELPQIHLTMFDDVQDLAPWQQRALVKDLENRDVRVGRWIARRLDVLSIDELLPSGGKNGRDYEWRRIEDWARTNRNGFEKLLTTIADRRIRRTSLGVNNFASLLDGDLRGQAELGRAKNAAAVEMESVLDAYGNEVTYAEWIETTRAEQDQNYGEHLRNAARWRALAILTHRHSARRHGQSINQPRPASDLFQRRGSDVMTSAELLVSANHGIPFYYGFQRLSGLASSNIEQFLRIGSAVFDKLLLLQVTGRRSSLSATEQDSIARRLANDAIETLPRDVPFGGDVQRLVQAIGTLAKEVTSRESASYSPGILGVGLKESQFSALLEAEIDEAGPELGRLRDVLRASIAHNILEPRGPMKVKNDQWMVFYLNRLLGPAFELPVVSSQFYGISINDMLTWLNYGYRPPSRQDRLLP